jgi:hypothetical protein
MKAVDAAMLGAFPQVPAPDSSTNGLAEGVHKDGQGNNKIAS